ncbi:MAG TPA: hydrolase [Longimicrobiaceae bacterium]|jgi:predicted alpha/beta-fold hydrolase|nr:hydrolase [Longimicrobiaceae bacterium]
MTHISFTPRPFQPAWWLRGAHAQTVAGRFLRHMPAPAFRRERVETPDGDFIDLDFADVPGAGPHSPLAVVIHGLEGSGASAYVVETCRQLAERGIRGVAMNFRSCSGEPNRTARFYHAGDTADLALVLDLLAERFPAAPIGAAGFSLGANVLLKYLGERGEDARGRVRAAVAVSVPFDLSAGADHLEASAVGRFYTSVFLRSLRDKFDAKGGMMDGTCDAGRVRAARSFRDFDDAATARLHGFTGADHYYAQSSSARFVAAVRVPTLILHSADDPFLPASAIPRDAIRANPHVAAAITDHGGHVGFIAGSPWRPDFWAESEAARFLAQHLPSGDSVDAHLPADPLDAGARMMEVAE